MSGESHCLGWVTVVFCAGTMLALTRPTRAEGWRPVTPEELALKAPHGDPTVDAEALSYEIEVADEAENERSVRKFYVRMKIFTDRGKEKHGQVDLQYDDKHSVDGIAARTTKPDGSVVELKGEDVHERTTVKVRGKQVRVKSFALPAVEPGAVVEYRWTGYYTEEFTHFASIPLQLNVPVQRVRLAVQPWSVPGSSLRMRLQSYGVTLGPATEERRPSGHDCTVVTAANVPAFKEEPDMPPEANLRASVLLYYVVEPKETVEQLWHRLGKAWYKSLGGTLKSSVPLDEALPAIVGDASTFADKVSRVCEFCRAQIKRIEDDASGLSADERRKIKPSKSAAETLARRSGTDAEIVQLFGALVAGTGAEARTVLLPDRSEAFLVPDLPTPHYLRNEAIAVRFGDTWHFYDPSESYEECGRLRWQNEGVLALLPDADKPSFVQTPLSAAEYSQVQRTGRLRLSEDGTLDGDVHLTYAGHLGAEWKEEYDAESAGRREQLVREGVKAQLSQAELEKIEFQNVTDPKQPLTVSYHVRVPGYAQRTGKRLFLQPALFQYGRPARFTDSQRVQNVTFDYPWSEVDTLDIELPPGYELDHPDAPAPVSVPPVASCEVKLSLRESAPPVLHFERRFTFGTSRGFLFPVTSYPALKQLFEAVNAIDNHAISLKQTGAAQ
jgi:hypothetical protein